MESALEYNRIANFTLPLVVIGTQIVIVYIVLSTWHKTRERWLAVALLIQTTAIMIGNLRTMWGYGNIIFEQAQMSPMQANVSILVVNLIYLASQIIIIYVSLRK